MRTSGQGASAVGHPPYSQRDLARSRKGLLTPLPGPPHACAPQRAGEPTASRRARIIARVANGEYFGAQIVSAPAASRPTPPTVTMPAANAHAPAITETTTGPSALPVSLISRHMDRKRSL